MYGRFKVSMTARQHGLRTIKELQDNTNKMGTIQPPLLIMNLNYIIPDELHLLLRITDRLIRNLIVTVYAKIVPIGTTIEIHFMA